ncbi:S26 family signal peptidase [Microbacterium oleivorans]|uniref:S26 family signal peptidase n=1 Tax=Microbacterium oleivorans TaxID=273677 RepID=A0A7D5JD91_9MICO|nr:S26 family signal peptidase [Microbacterium oleivorans]QLD11640.1 S26 family signal peptidase [Microbacterium oleivorans]
MSAPPLTRRQAREPQPAPARPRRWGALVADTALAVAGVAGALCVVLALATVLLDVRVTLFSTGSMSPTIPAGAAAIARGIPAAEIQVGDVVTVERPGKLPITHRVTEVAAVPDGAPQARRITMRGDANAVEDPFPYDVERVRVVVFSVPGVAPLLSAAGTPPVLAAVTIAATALVVGVFWPRSRRRDAPRPGASSPAPTGGDDEGSP